jgi:hypothetical protein
MLRSLPRVVFAPPTSQSTTFSADPKGSAFVCFQSSVQGLVSLALAAGFVDRMETFELFRTDLGVFRMFVISKPPLFAERATVAILTKPALPVSGVSPRDEHSLVLRCSLT